MSIQIVMPKAGLTMVEGMISAWKVDEGATVRKGDLLMEYENEKSVIQYEALDGGIIHLIAQEGDIVAVGEPIGVLAESPEEYATLTSTNTTSQPAVASKVAAAVASPATAPAVHPSGRVRATGLAKKLAREAGIELAEVLPSGGPDGTRITAKDVTAHAQRRDRAPAATHACASHAAKQDEVREIPWTGVRKVIARNMLNSLQQSAQCTSVCELDVTDLMALRQKLVRNEAFLGCKISVNDLLCMATVKMLQNHPLVNATFDGSTLYSHKHVNLSVAVATDDGLMVPVVKHADALTLRELSAAIRDLSLRARDKALRPEDQSGGTFTVSNVGMFNTDLATPIINLPEVAILGFGRTSTKVCYIEEQFVPREMMYSYLTFDHRVLDGQEVGRIFDDLQRLIENPELITA